MIHRPFKLDQTIMLMTDRFENGLEMDRNPD